MSLDSKCENCGHRKLAHLDNSKPTGTGACHHGYSVDECQCPVYVCDSEGSDIVDVNENAERFEFTSREYDSATDTLTVITPKKAHEELMAELQMHKATAIIDPNTETMTAEELARRLSMASIQPETKSNNPVNHPSHYVANGDQWQPTPNERYVFLNGSWLTPEEYSVEIMTKSDDPVNHPSHYTAYPEIEVIQLTRWMSFNLGNAVKYVARAGLKDSDKEIQDLEKAIWYIKDEIARKRGEYGTMQE